MIEMETRLPSRDVENLIPIARSTLLWMGDRLPVTRHGRPGKARFWSVKDIAVIYVAQKITDRGILPAAAIDMAKKVEEQFVKITVDEDQEGIKYYLVALLKPDAEGRYESIITRNTEEALAFVERGGAAVFNLTKLLTEAMTLILAHEKSKGGRNA